MANRNTRKTRPYVLRNKRVTLIDLGLDQAFDVSMGYVQSIIMNINVGLASPIADVDFIRTRNDDAIWGAMLDTCDVLHVMAHGCAAAGEFPTFMSTDGQTAFDLSLLADVAEETGDGLEAWAMIADGCRTGTQAWTKTIRDSLEHSIAYIGTSRTIGWHESTVFCAAFYGAYFKNRGRGRSSLEHAFDAAEKAIEAYTVVTGQSSPYSVVRLEPSRRAKKSVVNPRRRVS